MLEVAQKKSETEMGREKDLKTAKTRGRSYKDTSPVKRAMYCSDTIELGSTGMVTRPLPTISNSPSIRKLGQIKSD